MKNIQIWVALKKLFKAFFSWYKKTKYILLMSLKNKQQKKKLLSYIVFERILNLYFVLVMVKKKNG